jgi:5'-nucleotidase / UDP-sugar diphosphatase
MKKIVLLLALVSGPFYAYGQAQSQIIQILHTNDLHSHFEQTDQWENIGGYARLKSLIDHYKNEAAKDNIPSLVLDAGDLAEGTAFYMADYGRKSFSMLDKMGFDAITVGNHDYLMGTDDLNRIIEDVNPQYKMLAANFYPANQHKYLQQKVRPYHVFNFNGIKLGILGIANDEILFKWRVKAGFLENPIMAAFEHIFYLKKYHRPDAIVALTHIGINADKRFAKENPDIDFIVGGHSHTLLRQPVVVRASGKNIPIVHAGSHGKYLGRSMIEVSKNGGVKLLSYDVIPVENVEKDQEIVEYVREARKDLEDLYGKQWLYEVIGESRLPRYRIKSQKEDYELQRDIWMFHFATAMKDAVGADAGMQVSTLAGGNYPVGAITRESIINASPRFFDFKDKMGWKIYTAEVNGGVMTALLKLVMRFNIPLYFSGITYQYKQVGEGKYNVWDIKINGKPLLMTRSYRLALPEGIVRGGMEISRASRLLLQKHRKEEVTLWQALEDHLKVTGPIGIQSSKSRLNDQFKFMPSF